MSSKKYVDHKTAAEYLSIKPSTLYVWVSNKNIPVYKLGNSTKNLYKIEDLDSLIKRIE